MIINNHFAMCLNFNINRHQKIIMAIARTTPSRRFLFIFLRKFTMSYQRIVKMSNDDEVYKLAIVADFEDKNYSVAVVKTNHTKSSLNHHTIATYNNIQEATREYNHRLVHETQEQLAHLYDTNVSQRVVM